MKALTQLKLIALVSALAACGNQRENVSELDANGVDSDGLDSSEAEPGELPLPLPVHWHPGHYLDVGKADTRIMTRLERFKDEYKDFRGAQVTFNWGELQTGRSQYNFAKLDSVLAKLTAHGKRLVLRVEDRSFKQACSGNNLVPSFVGTTNVDNAGDRMCVAKIWESKNMDHMINLIKAIYDRYKENTYFEAIMTQETALPKSSALLASGYTRTAHFKQVKRLIVEGQGYAKTIHIMQMVNFLNGGRGTDLPGDLADAAESVGAAISNPDTHPATNSRGAQHDIPVYEAYQRLKGSLIAAPNFNTSDLDDELSVQLMQRIYTRAVNEFGASYVFWNSHGSSKFHDRYEGNFIQDLVLPVVRNRRLPRLNTVCPAKVIEKRGPCSSQ